MANQPTYFRSSFMTLDSTLNQQNNSFLYFRPQLGPNDSSGSQFFSLQPAIGADPSIRINQHASDGTILATGYLVDTSINPSISANPTFSTVTIVGNGIQPTAVLDVSCSSSAFQLININDTLKTAIIRNDNTAFSGNITFEKSRGGVFTQANDELGYVSFDGTNTAGATARAAYIIARQDASANVTYVPGRIEFHTSSGTSADNERMRIDSSGNVGIGTSSPATTLDVNGTTTIRSSSTPYLYLEGSAGQGRVYDTVYNLPPVISVTGNTGIYSHGTGGAVILENTGVLSISAGVGIDISGVGAGPYTGDITISSTATAPNKIYYCSTLTGYQSIANGTTANVDVFASPALKTLLASATPSSPGTLVIQTALAINCSPIGFGNSITVQVQYNGIIPLYQNYNDPTLYAGSDGGSTFGTTPIHILVPLSSFVGYTSFMSFGFAITNSYGSAIYAAIITPAIITYVPAGTDI